MGVERALRAPSPRPSATSTTWSTGSTCAATCASTPGSPSATLRRVVGHLGRRDRRRPSAGERGSGAQIRARFLIAATGVLSVPYIPDVPGRDDFRGEAHHTGLWPAEPVDFVGKRVAVVGTSSSGVQVVPTILDDVESLTVYQRTANWCTPLNNTPITADEQVQLRADFEAAARDPEHVDQRLRPPGERAGRVRRLRGRARRRSTRQMWNSPGFMKLTSNYYDLLVQRGGQRRVVRRSSPTRSAASSTIPRRPRS